MKLPAGYVPGIGVHKATAYGGYGEKLLKRLGWKEGQGLGAEGQGISSAIKVHKKEDTIGVGGRQSNREQSKNWWEQAYNSAAQTIQEGREGSSCSSSDDSEDNEPGTPPAKVNRDGTAASGTKEELRLARELAKDPWGRFGGRNGKLARLRRQEALAAASLATGAAEDKDLRDGKEEKEKSECKRHKTGDELDEAAPATKKRKVVEVKLEGESRAAPFRATPRTGWWGASRFLSAGCLEGLEEAKKVDSDKRESFTEDTQASLYNLTHAAKVSGKQGLGRSKGKAVGHDWKGSRKVFEDGAEDSATPQQQQTAASSGTKLDDSAPVAPQSPIKWKKLCKDLLAKEPSGKMKLSKILERLSSALSPHQISSDMHDILLRKVGKSSSFAVKGKTIRLRKAADSS